MSTSLSLSNLFGWNKVSESSELPEIFPISITQSEFVKTDVVNMYSKILTDVAERLHGLSDDETAMLWDSCVMSDASDGLITLLAKAMADRQELFLVYEKAISVIRLATDSERQIIRADYETKSESALGIFISFKNYTRSDMIKLYSGLEYCTVAALHKSMNLSKAVQFKMNDLRGSVSLNDSADVKAQAQQIAQSLSRGKDVLLDGKDTLETGSPDLTAVNASIQFIAQKLSFYLGLPASYILGEQTGGLNATGETDTRAVERGLKSYYFSIIKPAIEAIFDVSLSYKSQDFRQITGSSDVLKTFALVDESLISLENKTKIINQLFDLPEDAEGDPAPAPLPQPVAVAKPAPGQPVVNA